jgi:3-hydroxybutyrate dehydrogenase
MNLKGKVAVVTGAASGIGREIARTFGREGAKVVIADLELGDVDSAIGVGMDVTDETKSKSPSKPRYSASPSQTLCET